MWTQIKVKYNKVAVLNHYIPKAIFLSAWLFEWVPFMAAVFRPFIYKRQLAKHAYFYSSGCFGNSEGKEK